MTASFFDQIKKANWVIIVIDAIIIISVVIVVSLLSGSGGHVALGR